MKKYFTNSVIVFSCIYFTGCTNYFYKKANIEFVNLQYSEAIKDYNKVLSKEDNHDAMIKLANSYRLINELEKARPLYAEIVHYPECKAINIFHYAKVLKCLGDYSNAKIWYKNYLDQVPDDALAQISFATCNVVNPFIRDTTLFSLNLIKFPCLESAFSPVPYKGGIVFTGNKKATINSKKDPWTGKTYYDLYFAEKDKNGNWLSPQIIKGEINGRYHEGPAAFNKKNNVAYFTRSNYFKSGLEKSSKNENNLKLFKAKLVNNKWEQLEGMPFNSDEYSVGHPCLSKDEKTLYFISDMPGGLGGTDIYKSVYEGKKWKKPENLGNEINTSGNEMFPFISDDGTLYFSSDSHENMGGLDVFSTSYDEKNKKWQPIENLNYPLNSSKDDFAFVINKDNKTGFISSNRGNPDQIYEFEKHDPSFNLFGTFTEKGKGTPFEGAIVTLTDKSNGDIKTTVQTDKNGAYKVKLNLGTDYEVFGSKENNVTPSSDLSTKGKKYSEDFEKNFELDINTINFNLFGVITIKGEGIPFQDAIVTLEGNNSKIITIKTDKNGKYKMNLKPEIDYEIYGSKENYFTECAGLSTKGKKKSEEFERNFELEKIVIQKPIVLEHVFYDLAKWDIRSDAEEELNKLVKLLKINPGISIEIGSHTDSRAGDSYNMILSGKRANSVVDYLVLKGVKANRLTWKGYGETQLINKCKNGVECPENEHQQNRRK
ncbi:MAG: OmpA family protein [Bacteroidetes bacterium]|nr:OmpA family protein [Bacteroidota bacterium]